MLYLIERLDRSVYEPVVVCNKDGELADALRGLDVKVLVRHLHHWRKPFTIIQRYIDVWHLCGFARQNNVNAVHCCDLWLGGYMRWVAKRLGVPSILHVRMPLTPRDVRKFRCDAADRVVAISRRITANLLIAGIPQEKIARIDDSVDVERFSPGRNTGNLLREKFTPAGEILVGIIGRVDAFKRQMDFLQAAKEVLRKSNHSVTFFLIGEVHCHTCFRKIQKFIRKNGMDDHVRYTGRQDDMPAVMASLDILVSLSGGSVMFEAMAAGKAVISAGFTPKKYAYHIQDGRTGLLIESQEAPDLAQAIIKLVETPELRKQLGLEARKWATKELTHTKMAEKTRQLYDTLLAKSQNARSNG